MIIAIHTMTSPNTRMNAAPPTLRAITVVTINTINVISRMVVRIIQIRLLSIIVNVKIANFKYYADRTWFPIVFSAMA